MSNFITSAFSSFVVCFLPLLGSENAQTEGPKSAKGATREISLEKAPLFVNRLGPFELFKTTKADIVRVLGVTPELRSEEGECCGDELCYVDEARSLRVEFHFGPSGGFDTLTGYRLSRRGDPKTRGLNCRRSKDLAAMIDESLVRPGRKASDLLRTAGVLNSVRDGRYLFTYQEKVPVSEALWEKLRNLDNTFDEDYWDLVYWLDVIVKGSLIERAEVGRTETF